MAEPAARILVGDCRQSLRALPAGIAQTCVTSPPYWGLRDYGVEGQLGLEKTPEAFVERLVEVFREVRRVLAHDGTLWLNLGDSYANDGKWGGSSGGKHVRALHGHSGVGRNRRYTGLKPKDLVGIPWMVAFALRADGWYLRSDIVWAKPNPMPESVADRPTKAHEYIFLLSKSERYFYDGDAIREPSIESASGNAGRHLADGTRGRPGDHRGSSFAWRGETRSKRSVWAVASQPFAGAHFAMFPPRLIEPCILAGSRPGDVVIDPFSGAGTTGLVALRRQRSYIGIELNAEYAAMSEARIRADAPLLADVEVARG